MSDLPDRLSVRIEADGLPGGTRVFMGDQDISRSVVAVEFHHEARGPGGETPTPKATVTFHLPKVRVTGEATFRGLEYVPSAVLARELRRREDEDMT